MRAMILFKWFLTNLRNVEVLKSKIQEKVSKDLEKLKNIEDKESYEASVQVQPVYVLLLSNIIILLSNYRKSMMLLEHYFMQLL